MYLFPHILLLLFLNICTNGKIFKHSESAIDTKKCASKQSHFSKKRYILYDVNPLEGFNLRRDIYVRVATFLKRLIREDKHYDWILVLPPWGPLYHWHSTHIGSQTQLSWEMFFDIKSLKNYVPVIEMHEFISEYPIHNGKTMIDMIYHLQNDKKMFETGIFKDKNVIADCSNIRINHKMIDNQQYPGFFWGYSNISSDNIQCLIFHGTILNLKENLKPNLYRSVMFDHMEVPLHFTYGSTEYWEARRSMRYNSLLYNIAYNFTSRYFNLSDQTELLQKTKNDKEKKSGQNTRIPSGGPYLAIHFRRKDFILNRRDTFVTVSNAALQLKQKLQILNLDTIFVATDAEENEYIQLKNELKIYKVLRFTPPQSIRKKIKDGGVAIVDQIICSQASYFIGTQESTFTYRIQEDREILNFPYETTFNVLCNLKQECYTTNIWRMNQS